MAEKTTQESQSAASSQTAKAGTQGAETKQGSSRQEQGTRSSTGLQQRSSGSGFGTPFTVSPFSLMRRMMEDMDRMFEDLGGGGSQLRGGTLQRGGLTTAWAPAVDVFERDGQLVVRADLPGLKRDEVRIEVADGSLIIEGERRSEIEAEEEGGVYRSERIYGRFARTIPLPEGADLEHAQARFDEGVLEITVPLPQSGRRRIEIQGRTEGKQEGSKPSVRH
jgi:HSP20 family protein